MTTISSKGALMAAVALSCVAWAGAAAAAPARACADMKGLQLAGTGLVVTKAEAVPAGPAPAGGFGPRISGTIPAHCLVEGTINPRTGADGKPYGLRIAIALPEDWNGRFLFQGGGGLNGALGRPLGPAGAGDRPALLRGFAVVSTDGGHTGAVFDASFQKDQQAGLDFAFNSVPTVTQVAKQVVSAHYGRPISKSYFTGCSTGGREGMSAAERYPTMFDGIITGAPAMRTGHSNLGTRWAAVAFNRAGTKGADGKLVPGSAFSKADKKLIVDGILAACDDKDGVKDGLVFNTRACGFDPAALQCKGAKNDSCLSPAQAGALKSAFAGVKSASGRQVYASYPWDTGIAVEGPGIPGFLGSGAVNPIGPPITATSMDVEAEEARIHADASQQLVDTYNWTNLSVFFGRGGKQIFFHGMSDPWFSGNDTIGYYERLMADNGGAEKAGQSARLFLAPGMAHCAGGPGALDSFDLLTALVDWTENGKAPEKVTATSAAVPGRSRPMCAWPLHAHYTGKGSSEDAANFQCRP